MFNTGNVKLSVSSMTCIGFYIPYTILNFYIFFNLQVTRILLFRINELVNIFINFQWRFFKCAKTVSDLNKIIIYQSQINLLNSVSRKYRIMLTNDKCKRKKQFFHVMRIYSSLVC